MRLFVAVAFATSVLSWILTGAVRRYALSNAILDIPNERSSHVRATPRGGGLAIVATLLMGMLIGCAARLIDLRLAAALLGGVTLVAAVGWVDDRRGLSARVRAVFHFAAAVWATTWIGGLSDFRVGTETFHMGRVGTPITWLAIVWLINLYNFMDGIDGIAAVEAALVAAAAGVSAVLGSNDLELVIVPAIIAGAATGFLPWNWSPARIFMGDVGSGALGYAFAVLALASERSHGVPALVWLILLAVFAFDATVTLARRLARGERWYEAHRSHAYQRAVQSGLSHSRVTLAVALLNAALIAVGLLAVVRPSATWAAVLVAVGLTSLAYLWVERARPM